MDFMKNKKLIYVLIYAIVVIGFLYYIEQVMLLPYVLKTLIKIPLFTLVPWWLLRRFLDHRIQIVLDPKHIPLMFGACIVVIIGIAGAFILVRNFVDVTAISNDVSNRMKVDRSLIVFAAIYTTFINSFIEEYFFRGMLFLGLKINGMKKLAYMASALLFALYHVTIFFSWFSWPLMLLVLVGLFIGGLIFAWFADRTESLLGSWLIHITADAVLMVIGVVVLGIGL